jgi:hypothetical protein
MAWASIPGWGGLEWQENGANVWARTHVTAAALVNGDRADPSALGGSLTPFGALPALHDVMES